MFQNIDPAKQLKLKLIVLLVMQKSEPNIQKVHTEHLVARNDNNAPRL